MFLIRCRLIAVGILSVPSISGVPELVCALSCLTVFLSAICSWQHGARLSDVSLESLAPNSFLLACCARPRVVVGMSCNGAMALGTTCRCIQWSAASI